MKKFISKLAGAAMAGLLFATPCAYGVQESQEAIVRQIWAHELKARLIFLRAERTHNRRPVTQWQKTLLALLNKLQHKNKIDLTLEILQRRAEHNRDAVQYTAEDVQFIKNLGINYEQSSITFYESGLGGILLEVTTLSGITAQFMA